MINKKTKQKVLILDNIRSILNIGAIFRTADAIGIDKVYLTGYTSAPVDRFGRERSALAKAALGSEKSVEWEKRENVLELISELKKNDFLISSLEQSYDSVDYKIASEKINSKNIAIILGNEVDGVDEKVLKESDFIMEIPMRGKKESLNVSVATGVLLYRLFDK